MSKIGIIEVDSSAFKSMIVEVTKIVRETIKNEKQPEWISGVEAKNILNIKTTTLQKLRDGKKIIFSKITAKNILYSRSSINNYIKSKSKKNDIKIYN